MHKVVIVVPVFRHGEVLGETVARLVVSGLPVLVVSDGNDAVQVRLIEAVCRGAGVQLLKRRVNGGKGAAVMDGLREAARRGFTHAFQVDADGQHDLGRVLEFVRVSRQCPEALVLGYACYDESAPWSRRVGRWVTHVWVWISSLSLCVRDSMCGFRIYPIAAMLAVIDGARVGRGMEFDTELCVRAVWHGLRVVNLPVEVVYVSGGVSNFRFGADNVRMTVMHARLFGGMLWRVVGRVCRVKWML